MTVDQAKNISEQLGSFSTPYQRNHILLFAFETNSRWAVNVIGRRTDLEDKKQKTEWVYKTLICHCIIIPRDNRLPYSLSDTFTYSYTIKDGAIRSARYLIVGGNRINPLSSEIVFQFKMLNGQTGWCQMADVYSDRIGAAPFTYVGIDTFGRRPIVFFKSRMGQNNQNRWGILFTCVVVSRTVHIICGQSQ